MKASRMFGAVLAAGLGLSALSVATDTAAQDKAKPPAAKAPATKAPAKKEAAPAVAAEAPMTKKPVALSPAGLVWGMNHNQVAGVYDKTFDEDYKPKYKAVSPGVKMKALDAALAEEKSAFRRSRVDFGKIPTGYDSTPLRGEYSYLNSESVLSVTRNGLLSYLFFIQNKFWKIITEHKLGEGAPYGKDFKAATEKLNGMFGVPGRVLPADPAKGRNANEVDWKDANTHIRAVQRSDTAFALVLEDVVTSSSIASMRTNKPTQDSGIDPTVQASLGTQGQNQPGPKEEDKSKAGKKQPPAKPAPKK